MVIINGKCTTRILVDNRSNLFYYSKSNIKESDMKWWTKKRFPHFRVINTTLGGNPCWSAKLRAQLYGVITGQ